MLLQVIAVEDHSAAINPEFLFSFIGTKRNEIAGDNC
jgi:hypothetical protein